MRAENSALHPTKPRLIGILLKGHSGHHVLPLPDACQRYCDQVPFALSTIFLEIEYLSFDFADEARTPIKELAASLDEGSKRFRRAACPNLASDSKRPPWGLTASLASLDGRVERPR